MKKVKLTVVRKVHYADLSEKKESPIEYVCNMQEGQAFISKDNKRPEGMCESAGQSMRCNLR